VVVLVNRNGLEDTMRCLSSLAGCEEPVLTVVVDNASTEPEAERLISSNENVVFLPLPTNVGFGRANNAGIRRALQRPECEFVFILNNDTVVEPDTIRVLEATLDDMPDVGIAAPRIVLLEDESLLWYGGGDMNWCKGSASLSGFMGAVDAPSARTGRDVSFASGCAMLVRRSVWEALGGFDPRLFMYEEDTELCLRVRGAGWRIRYVPDSIVRHRAQGSTRRTGERFLPRLHPDNEKLPFFLLQITKNRLLTMRRHARGFDALRFWACFPVYWVRKCLVYALHGRRDAIGAVLSGIQAFNSERQLPFVNELENTSDSQ
jgi:GT2 family glycosyltransferase